jgi:hypothetical protein
VPRLPDRLVDAILFVVLALLGLAWLPAAGGYSETIPGIDELGWTAVGFDTWERFGSADRADPEFWREGLQQTPFGRINPNLGKLVLGARLASRGYSLRPPDVFPEIHPPARGRFGKPEFRLQQAVKHEPFVVDLRRLNRAILAVTAAVLFLTGLLLHGRTLGVLAWACFLFSPLVRERAGLVSTDNLLLLSSLLALLVGVLFVEGTRRGRWRAPGRAAMVVLTGLLLGAVVSIKLNGALSGIAFGVAALGLAVAGRVGPVPRWEPVLWALGAGLVSFGVFLALNPVLWHDVPGEISSWLQDWERLISAQQKRYFRKALLTPGDRVAAVWRHAALAVGPLGQGTLARLATGLLLAAGTVLLIERAARSLRDPDRPRHEWTVAVWVAVWCAGVTAWIPLRADRYYLPVLLALSLVAALPLAEAVRRLTPRSRCRSSR